MTPYTKKIVELHKIHKAIEEKDCCNDGGGTKEITIDDIVQFIHDNWNAPKTPFPYTTWNSIPNYGDVNTGDICKTNNDDDSLEFSDILLNIPNYFIGIKGTHIAQ